VGSAQRIQRRNVNKSGKYPFPITTVCRSSFDPSHLLRVASLTSCAGIYPYASPPVVAKLRAASISAIHPHGSRNDVPDDHAFKIIYGQFTTVENHFVQLTQAIQCLREALAPKLSSVLVALAELEHSDVHFHPLDPNLGSRSAQDLMISLSGNHLPRGIFKPGMTSPGRTLSTIAWMPSSVLRYVSPENGSARTCSTWKGEVLHTVFRPSSPSQHQLHYFRGYHRCG